MDRAPGPGPRTGPRTGSRTGTPLAALAGRLRDSQSSVPSTLAGMPRSLLSPLKLAVLTAAVMIGMHGPAGAASSLPWTPSWEARHHLQLLVDAGVVRLTTTHWPLPSAAVAQALTSAKPATDPALAASLQFVKDELARSRTQGRASVQLRHASEALTGFGESYTPGSSLALTSAEHAAGPLAWRLGARLEQNANSLQTQFSGVGTNGRWQIRLEESALVLGLSDPWTGGSTEGQWNAQLFSQRFWWGPGWQQSMVLGHNAPAFNGIGLQRGITEASSSRWLSWMGPWNIDVFVARAQDPIVVANQPDGFLYSGARLTMQPWPWLEIGFSRGFQAGGTGRPSGVRNFVKAFFGQEVNQDPDSPFIDSSAQIAGYDFRLRCPHWISALVGPCAAYTQWMGEDAAGSVPLPFKFMSLWGIESTYGQGRYRVVLEYVDTNAYSLPWDNKPTFPGYVNGVYQQGYTQGGRWLASSIGSGARVFTLGWMDAQARRQVRVHSGNTVSGIGAYSPGVDAPRGDLIGVQASQSFMWQGMTITPEVSWVRLDEGQDQRANKRENLRLGVNLAIPMGW